MKVNIPTSWEHITIKQFIEIYNLKLAEPDPIDYMIDVISIVCELQYQEVCKFTIPQLKQIIDKLEFLNTVNLDDKKIIPSYECDGVMYKACADISKITAGQYIDLKSFTEKDCIKNIHNIMSVLYVPYKKKYNEIAIDSIAETFYNKMPITIAYPFAVFFWHLLNNSMPDINLYLEKQTRATILTTIQMVKKG